MRILQLGDTHLGLACRTWGGPPGWQRSHDFLRAVEVLLQPALAGEVDLVVHTGDVFDRSSPPRAAVEAAVALFERVADCCPMVVVRGNHDRKGLGKSLGRSRGNLHIVDEHTVLDVAGLRMALVPHRRQAADWADDAAAVSAGGVDLLVCHQGVDGVRVPGFTFRVGRPAETLGVEHIPAGVRHILSGHIHPRQVVRLGDTEVVYGGSTERTAASEAEQAKGAVVWEWGTAPRFAFVDGPSRRLVRVKGADDLDRVQPGDFVSMAPRLLRSLGPAVGVRGGILRLPRARPAPSRQQLRLFG